MKNVHASQALTGTGYLVLGIALLATVVDILQVATVYGVAIPLIFIFSGYSILSGGNEKQLRNTGAGLIATGIIALLVRYSVIRGDVINASLGIVLVAWGVIILTRIYDKKTIAEDQK